MKRTIEQTEAVLLEEILYVIFKRKFLIIALFLIAGAILAYGVLTDVDSYRAEAIVMIRRLPLGYSMPAESRSVLLRAEVVNSEIEIITSPAVAEKVVDELNLAEGKNHARTVYNVNRQINAEAEPESNIIKLSYSHRNAERAALVTNAALDAYLEVRAGVSLDYDAVGYLDEQARRVKADIDSIGEEIARYGANQGQLSRGVKGEHHMGIINRFENQLAGLESTIYANQEKIVLVEEWLESGGDISHAPSGEIYNMATVRQAKLAHLELKLDLEGARARYAPDHPEVGRLEFQVEGAEQVVRSEVEQALLRERMTLEERKAELHATEQILDELRAENTQISDENIQIRLLEHELSIRSDLYAVIQDRREQFRITAATDPSLLNIGVVSRASVPVVPSKAGINMKSVFAFFTLLFGMAFVFGVERMDQSLVRRVDIERELGLKVFASIRQRSRL